MSSGDSYATALGDADINSREISSPPCFGDAVSVITRLCVIFVPDHVLVGPRRAERMLKD